MKNLAQQFAVYSTGQVVRFSDRPLIEDIVRRTESKKGGLRTLLHELVGSPLFTTSAEPVPNPRSTTDAFVAKSINPPRSTMMTTNLADVPSPVIRAATPGAEPASQDLQFAAEDTATLRVSGLFMPERVDDLHRLMNEFPEARLLKIDFETAQATIGYSGNSDLFRNAKPEQIVERLNDRVRQLSGNTFSLKAPGELPNESLQLVEIPIVGLDCKACSLAVHDILARIDGVEHATASFRDGLARAWIDPARTSQAKLEEALTQRRVTLAQ